MNRLVATADGIDKRGDMLPAGVGRFVSITLFVSDSFMMILCMYDFFLVFYSFFF